MEQSKNDRNFITEIIDKDLACAKHNLIITRFPPEPNGYLHIGHAKSICLNSGIARDYKGKFNLRFDDTNPSKEEQEYVDSIIDDVKWLGADFEDTVLYASDYFEKMYEYAVVLIKKGSAYVCDLTSEQTREYRGTLSEPGRESPYRHRSVEENLDLFERMRRGEFKDGEKTLKARIDMASPNLNMRDPVMYRIVHASHHRQGDKWCIYPMYDWAHGIEDSLEGITHSICTLEFENHRPLYEWFLKELGVYCPQQIEFARLNLGFTVLSKRKLLQLVEEKHVSGWDDPRMPTVSGLRRRGYTSASIRSFCRTIGVAKFNSIVDLVVLENSIRDELNEKAQRRMAVLRPLKVVIINYPENQTEELDALNNPLDDTAGKRKVPFSREIYIEQEDFREEANNKYKRLTMGREVRLRYAYFIKCHEVVKDEHGSIIELRCTYDPQTKGGNAPDGRNPKGTIHWVEAKNAVKAEVRLYDNLFVKRNPDEIEEGQTFLDNLNQKSLEILTAYLEPSLKTAFIEDRFQFERLGYFCQDKESTKEKLIFNRTVTLKDTWAKIQKA